MAVDPLVGHRVLGFDLETTGFSPKQHRIVQYALIGCDVDGSTIHVEELVNPQRDIPIETTNIHGIRNEDVRDSMTFRDHVASISELMDGAVIVGHNVEKFDWPFLRTEFLRAGQLMPEPLAIIDTLGIARKLKLPRSHKLGVLCSRYGISLENAHTAGADAAATLLLLHKIMAANPQHFRLPVGEIPDWINSSSDTARKSSSLGRDIEDLEPVPGSHGWLRLFEDGVIIGRGRNRGKTVSELNDKDPDYLKWLTSPAGPLENDAKAYLKSEML
ncbi:MAG: exonuclease domain-containing protein [Candidatus Thermoplasmatota archaeon]|nr:exonuclease domain-containing protein [Candidatus Thermoplasmatota archaeon]MEC9090942.1 exonuclease domain-containing protein [Candidatus Thermoplasmatota archaeon]MED5486644.1 exonuclease domain-containing protein [Candidatus Thermoplasmatota archaeon]|tara:strand:+ start:245 stop:1066 length:822 start_codon:yes stop_codon:yes gene_type:complete